MIKRNISAYISLAVCIICSAALLLLTITMPSFFRWMYTTFFGHYDGSEFVIKTVVTAFYCCVPFAAAALYMLIRLTINIIKEKIFILGNVKYFRYISWCCYAVALITLFFGAKYIPLIIVTAAMGVVGTLLRVVKNIMQSAVEIREENDLTI